jgi:hypothetical protein
MAGVLNVNSIYNSAQKKVSGKLTFQMGETLAAKVVSLSEDGKNVVVRTVDGWQFPALLEEPLNHMPETLLRLQVDGYDNGKIKLKIITQENQKDTSEQESLGEIIKNNNLSIEDKALLKAMVSFSIPLSRPNISKFKSLSSFLEKIQDNEDEILQFTSKYLKSKNIEPQSEKGKAVTETLKNFFRELKSLSLEELLLMEEVGIDITEDNVKSFKSIIKEPEGFKKALDTITKEIHNYKIKELEGQQQHRVGASESFTLINKENIDIKAIEAELKSEMKTDVLKKITLDFDNITYEREALFNNEVLDSIIDNMLEDLKPFIKSSDIKLPDEIVKKLIDKDPNSAMIIKPEEIAAKLKKIESAVKSEIRFNDFVKREISEFKDTFKAEIRERLSSVIKGNEIIGKVIENISKQVKPFMADGDLKQIDSVINKFIFISPAVKDIVNPEEIKNMMKDTNLINEMGLSSIKDSVLHLSILEDKLKETITEKLSKILEKEGSSKSLILNTNVVDGIIERCIEEIRPLAPIEDNKQISEIAQKIVDENPGIEVIIKPEEIKTKLEAINYKIKTEISFNEEIMSSVRDFKNTVREDFKEKLSNMLRLQVNGEDVFINSDFINNTVEQMTEQVQALVNSGDNKPIEEIVKTVMKENLAAAMLLEPEKFEKILLSHMKSQDRQKIKSTRDAGDSSAAIIEGIESKLENIKAMLESIVSARSELGAESWNSILTNVKSSANDLKFFNSISGQYYYLDVPIKLNAEEYPCKLIVKDDRKSGKKIDSNNVKMAVSITTVNMGIIDAYIAVKEKNMKIDFKCDEKWTKVFEMAKQKLWKALDNSVYNISINVSKREKAMNIVSCREFFEEARNSNINVMV